MKKPKQTPKLAVKKATAGKSPVSAVVNSAENVAGKAKMEATERLPTMFELAQIAAVLVDKKDLRQFEPYHLKQDSFLSITDAALGLWQNCGHTLQAAMKFEKFLTQMDSAFGDETTPEPPEWVKALDDEAFPIGFERGMKIICGPKSRRAEQHKALRDFLTAFYRNVCMDNSLGDADAQKKFTQLKSAGFSKMEFEEYARGIHEMKHEQTQEKAKKAAAARWGKKKLKK